MLVPTGEEFRTCFYPNIQNFSFKSSKHPINWLFINSQIYNSFLEVIRKNRQFTEPNERSLNDCRKKRFKANTKGRANNRIWWQNNFIYFNFTVPVNGINQRLLPPLTPKADKASLTVFHTSNSIKFFHSCNQTTVW